MKKTNVHTLAAALLFSLFLFLSPLLVNAQDHTGAFITIWDTSKMSAGTTLTVPSTGTAYQYYWERITPSGLNSGASYTTNSGNLNITAIAANTGTYRLYIKGAYNAIYMYGNTNSAKALTTVESWGTISWTTMASAFGNCSNLTTLPATAPDLTRVTDLSYLFESAVLFNSPIDNWNTGNITNMAGLFYNAGSFNQPINSWNTTNVTNMSLMFAYCYFFNQPIGSWNTGKVTNMVAMFGAAIVFNQAIDSWNTENVTDMGSMFSTSTLFNQPIANWNTAKVTNMGGMFEDATAFNQPIGSWNVANVADMNTLFLGATAFNQHIGNWKLKTTGLNLNDMFANSGLDCNNYSLTLQGWANNPTTPANRNLGTITLKYASTAQTYKNALLAKGWTINDGGVEPGCSIIALPVQLVRYDARLQQDGVLLTWTTASEMNNSHFVVTRSTDAIHFSPLGTIPAKGNGNTPSDYYFTDVNPANGKNYYRLSQVDLNGTAVQQALKVIDVNADPQHQVTVYPNPATDQPGTLTFTAGLYDKVQLLDVNGRLLAVKNIAENEGTAVFDTRQLASGIYIFRLTGNQTTQQKLVKQ